MRPTSCRARDAGYRSALLNTLARGARHLDANADKAPAGLEADHRLVRRGRRRPARPGRRPARRARRGRARPGARRRPVRRRRPGQPLAVRAGAAGRPARPAARLLFRRQADHARRRSRPPPRRRSPRFMASPWATARCRAGRAADPGEASRLTALIEGCGLRARPLRQARGWGYQRLSALGTIVVLDAAPPPPQKMAAQGSASTLAFEMSDGAQRLVVNCGGPGPLPTELPAELVAGPAHDRRAQHAGARRHQFDQHPAPTARSARASRTSPSSAARTMTRAGSRRATTATSARFGLIHKRSLMLGNDGKELRGADQLIAQGPQEDPRFRALCGALPPRAGRRGDRRPPTAWARSCARRARRRGISAAAAAMLTIEESLWIDGRGQPQRDAAACRSSAKSRRWAAKSAGSSAAPANQKDIDDRPRPRSPGADFAFRQERPRRACRRPRAARRRDRLDRRHRGEAARSWRRGARHLATSPAFPR